MDEQVDKPEDMETIIAGPDEEIPDDDFSSLDDDLDSLREKSTRTSDVYDMMDEDEGGGLGGVVRGFSPTQRLIIALLVFINVVACACAVILWSGVLS